MCCVVSAEGHAYTQTRVFEKTGAMAKTKKADGLDALSLDNVLTFKGN